MNQIEAIDVKVHQTTPHSLDHTSFTRHVFTRLSSYSDPSFSFLTRHLLSARHNHFPDKLDAFLMILPKTVEVSSISNTGHMNSRCGQNE